MSVDDKSDCIKKRFRGLLPVVVDLETSGLNPEKNALLELAAVFLQMDEKGRWSSKETLATHVAAFEGAEFDPESMAITGIDPFHPFRFAVSEKEALDLLFSKVSRVLEETGCNRAILVGHNAWFDLAFIQAARKRAGFASMPFHAFTTFDTATLSGLMLRETVLAKAAQRAGIAFNVEEAHSAIYDAEKTAELFCFMLNQWDERR